MKKYMTACALFASFTGVASADEKGIASYYHNPRSNGLIAAHRTLPFGSQVRVTNLDNGRATVVKIIDRGPFIRGRIIDVSTTVAAALGFREAGLAHVRIEKL
jgi:rare lipoprotein A